MAAIPYAQDGWSEFRAFLQDPFVLGIVLALFVLLLLATAGWTIRSSLRRVRARRQIVRYLDGILAVRSGDPEAGEEALNLVLQEDPENVGARIAYGDALHALRRSEEAHRQHSEAKKVFGAKGKLVDRAIVDELRQARAALEALAEIDRAVREHPRDLELLRQAWLLKDEEGLHEEALVPGRKVWRRGGDPKDRARLARTAARAAREALRRGEFEKSESLLHEAASLDPDCLEVRLLEFGLRAEGRAEKLLLETVDGEPSGVGRGLDLFPAGVCPDCDAWLPSRTEGREACPSCGSERLPVYPHLDWAAELDDPEAVYDEVTRNESWYRRLCRRFAAGEEGLRAGLESGDVSALAAVVAHLCEEGRDPRILEIARGLAGKHPEGLLTIWNRGRPRNPWEKWTRKGLLQELCGDLVRSLGEAGKDVWLPLRDDPQALSDPGLRRLILEFHVGLADPGAFEELLGRFSPVEITRHLGRIPPEALAAILIHLPEEVGFLEESCLRDPSLGQDEAFVLALFEAEEPALTRIRGLLQAKGARPGLVAALIRGLDRKGSAAERAAAVLEGFGREVVAWLVDAFTDPETPPGRRERLRGLCLAQGAAAVEPLCRAFGSSVSAGDEAVIEVLVAIGEIGVPALREAYRKRRGWLGRLGLPVPQARHPRACLIRALAGIPGEEAAEALQGILAEENDEELRALCGAELSRRRRREGGG